VELQRRRLSTRPKAAHSEKLRVSTEESDKQNNLERYC
jgi:hypothetical protein